jgi:hypothetical protein
MERVIQPATPPRGTTVLITEQPLAMNQALTEMYAVMARATGRPDIAAAAVQPLKVSVSRRELSSVWWENLWDFARAWAPLTAVLYDPLDPIIPAIRVDLEATAQALSCLLAVAVFAHWPWPEATR